MPIYLLKNYNFAKMALLEHRISYHARNKNKPSTHLAFFQCRRLRNTSELATYGIDLETLQYAEDKNERPHTEFIPDSQDFVLIFNSLDLLNSEVHYKTVPITFVAQKKSINYSLSSRK